MERSGSAAAGALLPGAGSAPLAHPSPKNRCRQVNDQSSPTKRIAVVGGGISGLAAAHRLLDPQTNCCVTLFDGGARLGGVLSTVHEDGYQVEQSADNFITTVPWGVELCQSLGLSEQLIQTNPAHRRTFVVRKGRLHRLPDGFLMMAPTRMWPLAVTPILSPWGKLRAALEYFLSPRRDDVDECMAGFVRRRLGREAFDRLVEPLVSAVYAADLERLSVLATLPRFREMERCHGSLIRAMRSQMAARKKANARVESQSGARYSMFLTLRDGLSSIVDAIAARLPAGSVRLRTTVDRLEPAPDGWVLFLNDGTRETFDAVILATPSHVAGRLLQPIDASLGHRLFTIEHSGTAILSVGYRRDQIAHPLDGMGVVVPAVERSPVLACSFSSQKYAHRAPEGHVLLRIFAGGARAPELAEMDDDRLCPMLLAETSRLLSITGQPDYMDVAHWPGTMPQYHVGHRELIQQIEHSVAALPNLALAGNAYHGVGVPNCIHSGQRAADHVLGKATTEDDRLTGGGM